MKQLKQTIYPGLLLSLAIASLSKILAIWLPSLGAGTIAILLGILLGNLFFNQSVWQKGTKFSEKTLLELSIVLLGTTVTFQTIVQIGGSGILFIMCQMTLTILSAYFIGKKLKFNQTMSLLMAGGNAVCGSSAIGAIAPEIGAKDKEKGQIITLVNLLGTVMMLTLPIIGGTVFTDNVMAKSALIGGTLQSVGQVIASANMVSSQVVEMATLFKILRIMFLVVVVFAFGKIANQSTDNNLTIQEKAKKKFPLPWYIIGFIICCVLNSVIHFPTILSQTTHSISGWFEITALAAIGLRINAKEFFKEGPRFLAYAGSVGIVQTIVAITLIKLLSI
ncbi:putative sulfate exporter family transporter [Vagococcus sp. CY53-2]|uniref:YeiH family protein n=1 Tax=Vagococcus sp. CY53-2 TaxID=2925780 RepID=UPI001F50AF67|nr:putative sulfate exporter family transporter [Vagococcus sp. CY53-2]MCI0130698.1 putative sulfate exporter family transporter [Vagococcus sp. CY53-2]